MMPFMGVRISWDIRERNCDFVKLSFSIFRICSSKAKQAFL